MVKRIGSKQRKTRHKFLRHYKEKGKISLSKYFQVFGADQRVSLKINPAVSKGQFFRRFHGYTGTITGKMKGSCYEITIRDGGKDKLLYVHPIHLIKQE